MDLRITATGKVFYEVPDLVGAVLLEAFPASFERTVPVPPKPVKFKAQNIEVATEPQTKVETRAPGMRQGSFCIGRTNAGVLALIGRVPPGEVIEYADSPDKAKAAFERARIQVPDEALKDYALAYKNEHRAVTSRPWNERREV